MSKLYRIQRVSYIWVFYKVLYKVSQMVFYKVCIGYRKGIINFRRYSIGTVNMYSCMCVCVICECTLPNQ